jgi:hypothetical protein
LDGFINEDFSARVAAQFAARTGYGYPCRVPRFAHRRLIVFFALLCQVLAAGIVHVPMAQAAPSVPVAIAASGEHCHDSAASDSPQHAGSAHASVTHATSNTGGVTSDPNHHCKSGFCGCVCVSAPAALPAVSAAGSPVLSHPPLLVIDQAHAAPVRAAVFFRPPIV